MTRTGFFTAATAALLGFAAPALAEGIVVEHAYARASTPTSPSGAAFMVVMNHSDHDDRLIGARSDIAKRVELHTHSEDADGVMRMGRIEDGIAIAAGATVALQRGGDHVMFMGLTEPLEQDSEITVTLTFEVAGEIDVVIPVDHARKPAHGAMGH